MTLIHILTKDLFTNNELFLAMKVKKEKELLKEIEQHKEKIVKREKSNPSHSDSEDSYHHGEEVDKNTAKVKKNVIDGD